MENRNDGTRLYRARDGLFLGVLKGFAKYFDLSAFWLRVAVCVLVLFTGIWPGVFLYFLAALVMKPEPAVEPANESEREFYESYVNSRTMALKRLKTKFDRLDERVRRMEDFVTSREYQWDRKLDS
jgi:phage shock protein C